MTTTITKLAGLLGSLALIPLATSCSQRADAGADVYVLCDMSASITEHARQDCPNSIQSAVAKLRRGDSLTLVRVTGDAGNDAAGDLERFAVPTHRELYDYDLKQLQQTAAKQMQALEQEAVAHPYGRTDLLGTVRLVAQDAEARGNRARLIMILSDYIQDDDQFNFNNDPRLAGQTAGRQLGLTLGQAGDFRLTGTTVLLGRLPSKDLVRLSRSRRQGIEAFWINYFRALGASPQRVVDSEDAIRSNLVDRQSAGVAGVWAKLFSRHPLKHDLVASQPDGVRRLFLWLLEPALAFSNAITVDEELVAVNRLPYLARDAGEGLEEDVGVSLVESKVRREALLEFCDSRGIEHRNPRHVHPTIQIGHQVIEREAPRLSKTDAGILDMSFGNMTRLSTWETPNPCLLNFCPPICEVAGGQLAQDQILAIAEARRETSREPVVKEFLRFQSHPSSEDPCVALLRIDYQSGGLL